MAKGKENSNPQSITSKSKTFKEKCNSKSVRTPVTVENKLKIIDRLRKGVSQRVIAKGFEISKTQVQRTGKNQDIIFDSVKSNNLTLVSKIIVDKSENKDLDDAVYKWFCEMRNPTFRCKPLPIARAHIQARALREAQQRGIDNFKASDGWFPNWKRRCCVGASVRLYGEAGDVDVASFKPAMDKLRSVLCFYKPENIFNMDETGLFYRAMPSRTYLATNENRRTVRGTKALKAKDRVTLVLCINATGSCKVDPLIVGTASNPHCFRDGVCPIPYLSQKNAWVDSTVYKNWWEKVFLPSVREFTDEPVALIMDNFSGHDINCSDETGQVTTFFFPPNSTSIHQPLDQGIISTVKVD